MLGHLIGHICRSVAEDRERQSHIRWWVRDLEDVLADPKGYLKDSPIRIGSEGAQHQRALAIIGLALFAIGWAVLSCFPDEPNPAQLGWEDVIILGADFLVFVGGVCVLAGLVLLFHQARQILLTCNAAEFRFRRQAVLCPWTIFEAEPKFQIRPKEAVLSINPSAVDGIALSRNGSVRAVGRDVRTSFFRLVGSDQLSISNVFRLDQGELASVLYVLAAKLKQQSA